MKYLVRLVLFLFVVLLIASPVARIYLVNIAQDSSVLYGLIVLAVVLFFADSLWDIVKSRRRGSITTLQGGGQFIEAALVCVLLMLVINSIAHCAG